MSGTPSGSLNFYSGSRLLLPLSNAVGFSLDQINFIACQVLAIVFGVVMRHALSPKTTAPFVRHIVEIGLGVVLGVFCFGSQIWHMFAQATICYVIMKFGNPRNQHTFVFVAAMGYLSVMHIYRMVLDYKGYTLDITGPLMVATQRLTSLACSIKDGTEKDESKLTEEQKYYVVKETPSVLEFYSYYFCFHNIMCGPCAFYRDYMDFIEGTCFRVKGEWPEKMPSPWKAISVKLVMLMVNLALMQLLIPVWPGENLQDEKFLARSSWLYIQLYMLISMSLVRTRYYFAWILGDIVNNANGLGFNGYDKTTGEGTWDLINNVNIRQLELSTSLKLNIDAWNISTLRWLRHCVYLRAPPAFKTLAVFVFSAAWHGFYPGYFLCFLTAALFTFAGRAVRRTLRPWLVAQGSDTVMFGYDCITFVFTRFANVYMSAPLFLLELSANYRMFTASYYYLHILAALAIVIFPRLKPFFRVKIDTPATVTSEARKEEPETKKEQ